MRIAIHADINIRMRITAATHAWRKVEGVMSDRRISRKCQGEWRAVIARYSVGQFLSPLICLCLSEETLKAGDPFYLVYMPGEVKDPTQGVNVYPVIDSQILVGL